MHHGVLFRPTVVAVREKQSGRAAESELVILAAPLLRELARRLGAAAHLSVRDGADVVTLSSVPAPAIPPRVPASCSSAGRALLFDIDGPLLSRLFPGEALPPVGRGGPRDAAELHRRIAAARVRGYAVVDRELEPGLVGVAAPVRDAEGRVAAALNVSGPRFRYGAQLGLTAGPLVKQAADELSRQLATAMDRARREGGRDG